MAQVDAQHPPALPDTPGTSQAVQTYPPSKADPRPVVPKVPAVKAHASYTSPKYGFRLSLKDGWSLLPRTASDVAEVRFSGFDMRGSYQVYEAAVTTDPATWSAAAKSRYESGMKASRAVKSLEFKPLRETEGGASALEFDTVLVNGGRTTTIIAFRPRMAGDRSDMHEIIITGEDAAAVRLAANAVLQAVMFKN